MWTHLAEMEVAVGLGEGRWVHSLSVEFSQEALCIYILPPNVCSGRILDGAPSKFAAEDPAPGQGGFGR